MAETVWSTVDRLIHDLGAIRAFVDEAEAMAQPPDIANVRGAMDAATDAITHLFTDTEDAAVAAAWTAIARAQDAVVKARELIAAARAGQEAAHRMRDLNDAQSRRLRRQQEKQVGLPDGSPHEPHRGPWRDDS